MKEHPFHDYLVLYIKRKLEKNYKEIKTNIEGKKFEFKGYYPDIILETHGVVVALMEVETEATITPKQAEYWKKVASLGPKLILMIPAHSKSQVADLLWKNGLIDKVSIATYDIVIKM